MRTALGTTRDLGVTALVVVIACLSVGVSAARGESSLTIDRVEVGFRGAYKVGNWTGISVEVTTSQPGPLELLVEAPDPDGNWATAPVVRHEVTSPGKHKLHGIFKLGRVQNALRVEVRRPEGEAVKWSSAGDGENAVPRPFRQSAFFVATIGHPSGWKRLHDESEEAFTSTTTRKASQVGVRLIELDSFDELPTQIAAYQSLDLLVIAGQYGIDAERSEVLRQWVRSGGHLIVSVGRHVAEFQSSELLSWSPVTVSGVLSEREMGGLEGYVGRGERLLQSGEQIPAARLESQDGEVLAVGLNSPFIIRSAVGTGRVTFVGVDLDTPPVSKWSSVDSLGRKLTGEAAQSAQGRSRETAAPLASSGVTDVASQLYRSLDGFPEIDRSSTWTVMGLLLGYLALIGPLDYYLVHRVLRRPQLTWLTLPVFVGVAVWLTVWGARSSNGEGLRANQLDVVDIDASSQGVRVTTWATVYSPETRRYPIELQPPQTIAGSAEAEKYPFQAAASFPGAWHGIPEDKFGGMYREGGIDIGRASYSLNPDGTGLQNVPIPIWSAKSVDAAWLGEAPSLVEADLSSRGAGRLSGTLQHHFRGALKDWVLAHGRQVYRPVATSRNPEAELAPREPWSIADASSRELSGYLTGTTQQYVESEQTKVIELVREQVSYDKSSRDLTYIAKILTFYHAAGGWNYTGLDNQALRSFDLTPLLGLNRAVLFGRIEGATASVLVDGKPVEQGRRDTIVRVILPVRDLRKAGLAQNIDLENAGAAEETPPAESEKQN